MLISICGSHFDESIPYGAMMNERKQERQGFRGFCTWNVMHFLDGGTE